MRLFSTFLSHLYLFRPAPTRCSTHLFSTYAPVYIYVCLSLYKSIRAVLSLFVASIPYLSYSSTHRSLRFPFELSPRFSPWLVYFSIAPFSCSRAIRLTRRSISSIEIPTLRIRISLSLLARVECGRVYIYIYIYTVHRRKIDRKSVVERIVTSCHRCVVGYLTYIIFDEEAAARRAVALTRRSYTRRHLWQFGYVTKPNTVVAASFGISPTGSCLSEPRSAYLTNLP